MIESSRRSFIKGLATLIAAPAIVKASALMPIKPTLTEVVEYGMGPAMRSLEDMKFLEHMSQQISQTLIYGNSEWMPLQFAGFTPNYALSP